jgi:hypothetical protein
MSFVFQSLLTFGLPLLAIPLVIHLINLRRHRRVQWAAMEFLLASQKRNRKWIVLKQLLLLLMRTAAIALVVFMLAGPVVRSGWAGLFGRGVTHHLILLDDSYSMSDHWDETTAFDQAKRAIIRILEEARQRSDAQIVTLLRFSEAESLAAGAGPELDRRPLDPELAVELDKLLAAMQPSESSAGPREALQAATRLPEPAADETRIAYLVTDFRRPQWNEQAELRQQLGRLRDRAAKLLLVQCAYESRPNLAVTQLRPEAGIRAAGIETSMEVEVTNYGDENAAAVTVAVEQDGARLPVVEFDDVPAGESVARRFRATFAEAGPHQLQASIESDAIEADNRRYFAAQIPAAFPVLVIDGSPERDDGYFLSNALSPGGRPLAGWTPQTEPVSFLRKHEALADFAVICLLDVPRIDEAEVEALESYVKSGGGLAVFLGPESQPPFYNELLYRDGEGLLPAPLDVPTQLIRAADPADADLRVTDHPLYRVFAGQRNSFLGLANFNFFYALEPEWNPPKSGDVRILARLRNGAPLTVEKRLGAGRVVVHLSKLSPNETPQGSWSNFSVNPVFPVFANELVGYLSAARRRYDVRSVEEPLSLTLAEAAFQADVKIQSPAAGESGTITQTPVAKDGKYDVIAAERPRSGVWQFELKTRDGKTERRYVAVNVEPGEGDLHLLAESELAERLRGIDYQYARASDFASADDQLAGFRLSDGLLYALAALLILEQLVAVAASYHPDPSKGSAKEGTHLSPSLEGRR